MASAENPEAEKSAAGAAAPATSAASLNFFGDKARPIDPDVAARVLRKIDLFLMPAMVIGTRSALLLQDMADKDGRIWSCILG